MPYDRQWQVPVAAHVKTTTSKGKEMFLKWLEKKYDRQTA